MHDLFWQKHITKHITYFLRETPQHYK